MTAAAATFFLLAIIVNVQEHGWVSWFELAAFGERIPARITSRNPEKHDGCSFEYSVNASLYTVHQGGCRLDVGAEAEAIYLPSEPEFATLRSPAAELLFRVGVPLVIAAIAGLVTAWRMPREAPRP